MMQLSEMVVPTIIGREVRPVFGDASDVNGRQVRKEPGIGNGSFQAVLIGKDGGITLRSSTVVSDVDMFGLIDRMPRCKDRQG